MSKITVTGQLTLTGGQLTAKDTAGPPPIGPQLWSWGRNTYGQLGLGYLGDKSSPVQIGSSIDWASISDGGGWSIAIKTDGTLWAWGNASGGRLGNGTITPNISSPIQIGNLTDWTFISANSGSTLAIKTDGTLWSWGVGSDGRLGLGDIISRSSPVQISALTDWVSVGGSAHVMAIKTDGSLWAWGHSNFGKLGLGNEAGTNRSSPVQLGSLTDWASVSANGSHVLAVKTNGSLWSWGRGNEGQLGQNDVISRSSPVQVGILSNWASVNYTTAIKTDGTLWSWGSGNYGRLGHANTTDYSSPVQVGILSDWADISAGNSVRAIKTDGTLWAWGANLIGSLGLGDDINRSSPVQVGTLTTWIDVDASFRNSTALKIGT